MTFKGFVKLKNILDTSFSKIYVEYQKPTNESNQTIVFVNGLSDSIDSWYPLVQILMLSGYGFLLIDLRGQGLSYEAENAIKPLQEKILIEEQVDYLEQVVEHFGLLNSNLNLVGFSYGGGVALKFAAKHSLQNLILFSPYIIRLDQAFPLQRIWWSQYNQFAKTFSGLDLVRKSYEKAMDHYMDFRYENRIPEVEKRKSAKLLTHGIMHFTAFDIFEKLSSKSVHLISFGRDTLVPSSLFQEVWSRLPEEKKCTWLKIEDGEHLILEQAPIYCAKWIDYLLSNTDHWKISDSKLYCGQSYSYEASEVRGTDFSATSEDTHVIHLGNAV